MSNLRALLVALTILAMAAAPLLVPALGSGSATSSRAYAATAAAPVSQDNDDEDNDDDGDNDDGDNDDDGDDNDNSGGDDNDNSGDDDNDNNGDDDDDSDDDNDNSDNVYVAPPAAPAPPPAPACSTPGQETSFVSGDGRVNVRVFSTMSQAIKFSIRQPIDPASVPPAPGAVVGGLLFQLIAETCDGSPLATLPAEVNLGVSYADADAAGLNESNFTLSRLDTSANQWRAAAKQATDPPANYTSATITEMGFYVLHQR